MINIFLSPQNLVSERDDERDRMRKELVASRERLHLLHMRQNSLTNQTSTSTHHSDITTSTSTTTATPPTATSPHTSRPSSFVSVASSVPDHSDSLDHHDTDEGEVQQQNFCLVHILLFDILLYLYIDSCSLNIPKG